MVKGELLKKDWFIALVFSLLFLIGVLNGAGFLERLERIAYDAGIQSAHRNPGSAENIAIVAIDDESIQQIGRWPWSRSVLAEVVDKLSTAKAKVVGLSIFLNEPQTDAGPGYIRRLSAMLGKAPQMQALMDRTLTKNPDQRYQTGDEFCPALRKCLDEKIQKKEARAA